MTPQEFKAIRELMGLSQREMCAVLEIKNKKSVQRYENGKKPITGKILHRCRLFRDNKEVRDAAKQYAKSYYKRGNTIRVYCDITNIHSD